MRKLILFVILGLNFYSESYAASEQVFKINNTLSQIDLDQEDLRKIDIFNQLINDIKNFGVKFSYSGTSVVNDYRGIPYFKVKDVKIFIKKEVFEKYAQYADIYSKKTLFNNSIEKFGSQYIFSNNLSYQWSYPKFRAKIELLDANGGVLASNYLDTQFLINGTGMNISDFFAYTYNMKNENKKFDDIAISSNISRDQGFDLSLKDIQRVDSIKFSVVDNPKAAR